MTGEQSWYATAYTLPVSETRACNCVGPQNGAPACPCMMPAYNRRVAGERALDILERMTIKPKIRVKAGRREVAA